MENFKKYLKKIKFINNIYRKLISPKIKQSELEIYFVRKLKNKGLACAVDVGANVGTYAVEFSKVAQNVFAFEPLKECAEGIENLKLKNTQVFNYALSDEENDLDLKVPLKEGAMVSGLATLSHKNGLDEYENIKTEKIKAIKFDNFWKVNFDQQIDIVKIDVEGYEMNVLDGMKELIPKYKPIFLVEIEKRHNPDYFQVFNFFEQLNYKPFFTRNGISIEKFDVQKIDEFQNEYEPKKFKRGDVNTYINNFFFLHKESDFIHEWN
jgi:FkbM family methyltransferase